MRPIAMLRILFPVGLCLTFASTPLRANPLRHHAPSEDSKVSDTTWVDHDACPIQKPRDWQPGFYGHLFRDAIVEPVSHIFDVPDKLMALAGALGARPRREAVNVNAFDEVPNSTWFTNRNHVRSVPVIELEQGPDSTLLPSKPWTVVRPKQGGTSAGFQIRDSEGRKWLVKLDWHGYPELSSRADMVARTLLHAAGYNVPHNEPVRFRRDELAIDEKLANAPKGRFTGADLDAILAKGARDQDGDYLATASLFLPGHALGSRSINRKRPGDSNDWYSHANRRELRGFYVVCSWLGFWDTKDDNFLDIFDSTGTARGHVEHYILDPGSSFGANADGVKPPQKGFENTIDFKWTARRLVTLGFVEEPWRRAHQDTGLPSLGRFESAAFQPNEFEPEVPDPAFRAMTDRDAYWGAKIVASFSDAQIRAAVDAAHYQDPRARDLLVRHLIQRRDKIARYWFDRVAPLDFFVVQSGDLRFRDLAVDLGMARARRYEVRIESARGGGALALYAEADEVHGLRAGHSVRRVRPGRYEGRLRLDSPDLPLTQLDAPSGSISLHVSIAGSKAKPTHVVLMKQGSGWVLARVRHG